MWRHPVLNISVTVKNDTRAIKILWGRKRDQGAAALVYQSFSDPGRSQIQLTLEIWRRNSKLYFYLSMNDETNISWKDDAAAAHSAGQTVQSHLHVLKKKKTDLSIKEKW